MDVRLRTIEVEEATAERLEALAGARIGLADLLASCVHRRVTPDLEACPTIACEHILDTAALIAKAGMLARCGRDGPPPRQTQSRSDPGGFSRSKEHRHAATRGPENVERARALVEGSTRTWRRSPWRSPCPSDAAQLDRQARLDAARRRAAGHAKLPP
jgi:hypothetical protein